VDRVEVVGEPANTCAQDMGRPDLAKYTSYFFIGDGVASLFTGFGIFARFASWK
jgi:hypothetical protein